MNSQRFNRSPEQWRFFGLRDQIRRARAGIHIHWVKCKAHASSVVHTILAGDASRVNRAVHQTRVEQHDYSTGEPFLQFSFLGMSFAFECFLDRNSSLTYYRVLLFSLLCACVWVLCVCVLVCVCASFVCSLSSSSRLLVRKETRSCPGAPVTKPSWPGGVSGHLMSPRWHAFDEFSCD